MSAVTSLASTRPDEYVSSTVPSKSRGVFDSTICKASSIGIIVRKNHRSTLSHIEIKGDKLFFELRVIYHNKNREDYRKSD